LVEAALRADPVTWSSLGAEHARRVPRRGSDRVAAVLGFARAASESVLESRTRVLWHEAGLPPPCQQAVIRADGRFLARVDFLWEDARLIVEVDGLAKYAERGALQDEKARQNRLVAAGYTVRRFTWSDVVHRPEQVVRQVQSALRKAAS
jgi:hypothetical protein